MGGYFRGTVDFDLGAGESIISVGSNSTGFIASYSAAGELNWVETVDGEWTDTVYAIAFDEGGDLYLAGRTGLTANFGSLEVTSGSSGSADYLARVNREGEFQWVRTYHNDNYSTNSVDQLAISAGGLIYAAGSFSGTVDFDPGPTDNSITTAGSRDGFLLTLDIDGNFQSVETIGGPGNDTLDALTIASNGSVLVGGRFRDTVQFGTTAGQPVWRTAAPSYWSGFC